jgi:hypothetical protein
MTKPKIIQRKEENFTYFLFEIDNGLRRDLYIHRETQKIEDRDDYIENKLDAVRDKYKPDLVEIDISDLGQWEYNALKQKGAETLLELWNN